MTENDRSAFQSQNNGISQRVVLSVSTVSITSALSVYFTNDGKPVFGFCVPCQLSRDVKK